ncbi:MAG TPA: amidohydrolase family protein, partial [Rhodanobacter sp.]|nr:amidohydrolase family protein [Rhodanobacter sp.]
MRVISLLFPITLLAAASAALAGPASVAGFPPQLTPADLVLRDAVVATLDPLQPQAQAIAVRDGKIAAVGSNEAIRHYVGKGTKVMDLHGAFVTPGFIEGHGHLMQTGESLTQLNVGAAANWDEIVAMVKAAAAKAKPGEWILGKGWLETKWDRVPQPNVLGLPLPASLDAASPNNPVLLITASYHGVYANAAALKLAGITAKTPDPVGGSIVHDTHGNPIGMLRDTAADPVYKAYSDYLKALPPADYAALRRKQLDRAMQNELSKGITTFVDMGENFQTIDWLKQQAGQGIPLRLYLNVDGESVASLDANLAKYRTIGYADNHFTVRGIGEVTSDGALGTRSAWFTKPYSD